MADTLTAIRRRTTEALWGWSAQIDTDWDGATGEGLIGQADDGEWFAETRSGRWVRLKLHRPTHLVAFLRSRHRGRLVMLERS